MSDIFLSYSRDDQATAHGFAEALQHEGFSVWWDQALDAGENFDKVTEQALKDAKAVVVLWSKKSVDSKWVRSEATLADRYGTLVPVAIEPCDRPIMFELNHTADLSGWNGNAADARWRSLVAGLKRSVQKEGISSPVSLVAPALGAAPAPDAASRSQRAPRTAILWGAVAALIAVAAGAYLYIHGRGTGALAASIEPSIAVLPFKNFSADPNQDYFADGITEQILNSLAGIPDPNLKVTARTSSFAYKGKDIDPREIGETLGVANILEGSVQRDGDQVANHHTAYRRKDRLPPLVKAIRQTTQRHLRGPGRNRHVSRRIPAGVTRCRSAWAPAFHDAPRRCLRCIPGRQPLVLAEFRGNCAPVYRQAGAGHRAGPGVRDRLAEAARRLQLADRPDIPAGSPGEPASTKSRGRVE